MLKEYITNLMDSNQEEIGLCMEKLKKLQQEYQTGQEWIANLQKENDLEQNIFSPRIAAAGGLEKLEQAQEKQQATEKQMEKVKKQLGELKKKEEEYRGLLREADTQTVAQTEDAAVKNEANTLNVKETVAEVGTGAGDVKIESEEIKEPEAADSNQEKSLTEDTFKSGIWIEEEENPDNDAAERCGTGVENQEAEKISEVADKEKNVSEETKREEKNTAKTAGIKAQPRSAEAGVPVELATKIREALERKNRLLQADQENENLHKQITQFRAMLAKLYSQTELCMALMNADRKKCKSEMDKMKKMIKKYEDMLE